MEDERNSLLEKYKPNTSKKMRNSMDDLFKTKDSGFKPLSRNKLFNSTRNLSVTSNLIKSQSQFNRTVKLMLLKLSSSVRCWGMSDLHSANTLQNSIYSWSFGKANRFEGIYKTKCSDVFYDLPKIKTDRIPSFGIGGRCELVVKTGKDSPPPNTYKILTSVDLNKMKKKGPIFGERIKPPDPNNIKFPGPGTYTVCKEFWKDKQANHLKSRISFFYDEDIAKQKHCLSPQKYLPSTKIQQSWRFNKITFGVGGRSPNELTYMIKNPGPGSYNPPSVFDKGRRFKTPLN